MRIRELNKLTEVFAGTEQMPVLFLGHGSPMNAIEDNEFSRKWEELGNILPRPNAILCISAHWAVSYTHLTLPTIYSV